MTASLMQANRSLLVLVDYQARLMPAIEGAPTVLANAKRLLAAADILAIPVIITEQNAKGIGPTTPDLDVSKRTIIAKQTFGSCATPEFVEAIGTYPDIILAGCEAHVCVTQTVLGLLELGRRVFLVADATGARTAQSKQTAVARMARNGAEVVTTEMVIFEWLATSEHEKFRAAIALVK
ncbi:MAG: isochorismatase family protein [Hyphomicrobiaceae bacterium]